MSPVGGQLLTLQGDVLWRGLKQVLRSLDNATDLEVGYILMSQVRSGMQNVTSCPIPVSDMHMVTNHLSPELQAGQQHGTPVNQQTPYEAGCTTCLRDVSSSMLHTSLPSCVRSVVSIPVDGAM